ncbi:unnamed protein product [Symbiodinium sp. CCMP2592]|nr:unnamed protein product [Symbiodinium sp. CCMP2592]
MAGVPEKVVQEVEAMMSSTAPVNTKVDQIVQLLRTHGLAHDQVLTPSQILVHPENRGKSMVSYYDVWSKGSQMTSVGFQPKLLDGQTICTQMATAETKRLAQVQANRQLVSEAKGHLAPVSGQEGFLSLAGSHSVAFLRCLQAGIQGPEGYHVAIAKSDPAWRAIEQGWCWIVLAASIEEAMPQLPNFIQHAANSSNSISKAINELEVALHVATAFEKGLSLPDAIQQASQGDVRCRASVPAIAKFVQNFGGGSQGFPLLHFLANFGKQFNATLLVGTELMSTLVSLDFKQATCIFPMLRVAAWATMLTSPKSQDGFSRILSTNDLQKLKAPGMLDQVTQAENMLQEAWKVQQDLLVEQTHHASHLTKCFGRFAVRVCLFLTNKQRAGRETKHWQSLQAILTAYTKEIQDSSAGDAIADHSMTPNMQVTDVLAASNKTIAMLQNNHMELGKLYTTKDHGAKVFKLTDVTDDHATMTHKPLFQDEEEVHVPLQKLPMWKATKAMMPMLCPQDLAREGMTAKLLLEERARSEVQLALHRAAEKHHVDAQTIAFGQNPQGLFAIKTIRKTIRLVPLGTVNKAKSTAKETKLLIQHGGHSWTIGPFRQNAQFERARPPRLPAVCQLGPNQMLQEVRPRWQPFQQMLGQAGPLCGQKDQRHRRHNRHSSPLEPKVGAHVVRCQPPGADLSPPCPRDETMEEFQVSMEPSTASTSFQNWLRAQLVAVHEATHGDQGSNADLTRIIKAQAMKAQQDSKATVSKQNMKKPAASKTTEKPVLPAGSKTTVEPEAMDPMEDTLGMTKAQLQAMFGPGFEPNFEEPIGGHLALHCSKPGCSSWVWCHKLYQRKSGFGRLSTMDAGSNGMTDHLDHDGLVE